MELLSPAGSYEKLLYAVKYGADAVYISGKKFGLRAKAENFDITDITKAVEFAHKNRVKIYVTLNIYPFNKDLEELKDFIIILSESNVDAVIVSDIGVFNLVKEYAPGLSIHISTQANVTSWKAAESWYRYGAKRIILARELSSDDIKEIRQKVPQLELEIFVHGAMCMAYSGRCLLSTYLNNRNSNQGLCTHPCRWKFNLTEESRPGMFFPLEEDNYGSYILNTKDLCLINEIPRIMKLNIDSVKIEGRMKSLYYIANTTRVYKTAITQAKKQEPFTAYLLEELKKISHRNYSAGFFHRNVHDPDANSNNLNFTDNTYNRNYQFIGEVIKTKEGFAFINVRSKFSLNDQIDFIFPDFNADFTLTITEIFDEGGLSVAFTKPNTVVSIPLKRNFEIPEHGIVRMKLN